MKNEEMMQPLEEDELEEVSGGLIYEGIYQCSSCGRVYPSRGDCPKCGGTLVGRGGCMLF